MKTKLIVVFILAFILFSANLGFAQEYDFREAKWGMSKEEVKNAEVFTLDGENEKTLQYRDVPDILIHMNVDLAYFFSEDKLYKAAYYLSFDYPHSEAYVYDFETIKNALTEQYDSPKEYEVLWLNEFYKDKEEYLSYALENGLVGYFADWETSTTFIELILLKFYKDVEIALTFSDKTYEE